VRSSLSPESAADDEIIKCQAWGEPWPASQRTSVAGRTLQPSAVYGGKSQGLQFRAPEKAPFQFHGSSNTRRPFEVPCEDSSRSRVRTRDMAKFYANFDFSIRTDVGIFIRSRTSFSTKIVMQ
jgi:hypothetical protein